MAEEKERKPIRVSLEEAKRIYDEEEATVLDVVDPGSYEELDFRIQGAVRIDPGQIDEEFERLPKERTVLTYCT
ncbi:MAG: hypothetical protein R3300_14580 [Candidatus Promineifilaceae bacterium]|nr:hypothetical protein [Candidatus Promineifilaceae bacterium]